MKKTYILIIAVILNLGVNAQSFFKGVDLSYVNEMEDCGAVYYENSIEKDPFQIMADHGANLVRVRIWHNPLAWHVHPTSYSSYQDVVSTISRAKNLGLNVLLDFHYSDTWTDPGNQIIPSAWESMVNDIPALTTELYNYTYQVLTDLDNLGLMPELVQVGNETNGNMLSLEGAELYPVDWSRQSAIINAGINAVRDAGSVSSIDPQIVLHVADPNNGDWWFGDATSNGINDFDIMGLSFYPEWHSGSVSQAGDIVENLIASYGKDVMLVEVAVPWTEEWNDDAGNMLSSIPSGYEVSPTGQRDWLIDLSTEVQSKGGLGVIYWEPAWVSTGCSTEWGTGSHWENATFFDFNNNVIPEGGIQFLENDYGDGGTTPPNPTGNVTFMVDMSGVRGAKGGYVTGDFTGSTWSIIEMTHEGNDVYSYTTTIAEGLTGAYYFLKSNRWNARETVPTECALMWGNDRQYIVSSGQNIFAFAYSSCASITNKSATTSITDKAMLDGLNKAAIYPNPVKDELSICSELFTEYRVFSSEGKLLKTGSINNEIRVDFSTFENGAYIIELKNNKQRMFKQVLKK